MDQITPTERIRDIEARLRAKTQKSSDALALDRTLPLLVTHLEALLGSSDGSEKKRVWVDFKNSSIEEVMREFDHLKDVILESYAPMSNEERNKIVEMILYYMGLTAWEYSRQINEEHTLRENNLRTEMHTEKENREWFESVLDFLPVGILVVERTTGNILFANKMAHTMAGGKYPVDIPADLESDYFVTDADGRRLSRNELPRYRVARGEKLCGYELTGHYPGGQTTAVVHSGVIPASESRPERLVLAFQEIGDRKNWERWKEREVKDLKEERTLRESFVSSLTHDLRTPLAVARMHSEMLTRSLPEKDLRRMHNIIQHIDIVDRMIQDLLDANKLKAGEKIPIEPCELNLNDVVEEAVRDSRDLYGDRFFVRSEEKVEGYWCGKAMRRILDNLLSNAVKYGDPEGPIEVSLSQGVNFTTLEVHNFGSPISPELQKKLFEPFKRFQKVSGKTGWGIGLALVKGLVEAHQGEIFIRSSKEKGTTFSMCFPNRVREGLH